MLVRGGWYLPERIERLLPQKSRGLRSIDPSITMETGQQFRDWAEGGTPRWITVHQATDTTIVLTGTRGATRWSWVFTLDEIGNNRTRLHTRFRMSPILVWGCHIPWSALRPFEPVDALYMEWFRQGLNERLGLKK